jgi:hypothetical protein
VSIPDPLIRIFATWAEPETAAASITMITNERRKLTIRMSNCSVMSVRCDRSRRQATYRWSAVVGSILPPISVTLVAGKPLSSA